MWDDLNMNQKAEVISMAIKAGLRDIDSIRSFYENTINENRLDDGGYVKWKQKASKYKNLDIDNDITYDYEGWYNENPKRAWDFLNDSPNAHFTDKYKTVYHPTFSTQSKYSGEVNSKFNPNGLIGGTWSKDNYTFIMSPDSYRGPVSMDERKAYLEDAEDNGVQLREADGTLPIYDNDIWGGVLPTVTIRGNKYPDGGKTYIGGADREVVITPEQTFMQSVANRDPYVDYQFYSPTGNSIVQTINSTPRWQQYWADREGSRVSNVMHQASPRVLDLLTAVDAVATGPEAIEGLYGLYNLAKSSVRNGVRRIATAAKTAPKITEANATSITPEQWTAAQDIALARGNIKEAQRLRDLHFKINATSPILSKNNNPLRTYHTVSNRYDYNFNQFNPDIEGVHSGIFTTDDPIMSASYFSKVTSKKEQDALIEAIRQRELHHYDNTVNSETYDKLRKQIQDVYGNPKKARKQILQDFPFLNDIEVGRQKELYLNIDNPLILEGKGNGWNRIPLESIPESLYDYPVVTLDGLMKTASTRTIDKILSGYVGTKPKLSYDGAIFRDIWDYGPNKFVHPDFNKAATVFDVQSPNNLKLADAVTYDDSGVRIPLGLRDNFKLNDIRYGLIPLGFGLGAATLPNKSRRKVK